MFHSSQLRRRELLALLSAGVAASSASGWLGPLAKLAAQQAATGRKHKSCVLLWMDGGPSHVETFDSKPDAHADVRGGLEAIATSVPGIFVGEKFPELAKWVHKAAILSSMSTPEADHGRARIYMHTGFRPGQGGVNYPTLGSIASAEIGSPDSPIPNFVVTGTPLNKHDVLRDPGYLGPVHQPLVLEDVDRGLENAAPAVAVEEFDRRTAILTSFEQSFRETYKARPAQAHAAGIEAALRLMRSGRTQAFDIGRESPAARDAYGDSEFGRGCLLARRLVEAGVAFVEVYLQNWDSHEGPVAERTRTLMSQVDRGAAALVRDLDDRGLLDDTLIIWMGEFGRSPRVNRGGGRDHYAKAWSTLLLGGGIRGGQVVGKTDGEGKEVLDRPITAADFVATVCRILGIDHRKEIVAGDNRPIRLVDKNERVIEELF